LGHFLQGRRESVNCPIDLRPRNDERRLEANHVAIDTAHANQDTLPQ
jgi:hypothetical protein